LNTYFPITTKIKPILDDILKETQKGRDLSGSNITAANKHMK
jgi:hypothetical protein